jgi:hypothetical protein
MGWALAALSVLGLATSEAYLSITASQRREKREEAFLASFRLPIVDIQSQLQTWTPDNTDTSPWSCSWTKLVECSVTKS